MRNLLGFYLPQILKITLRNSCWLLLAILVLVYLPIDEGLIKFLSFIGIFLLFPIITFFNKKIYLPHSLGWLLLTPISKGGLIVVNIMVNLIKALMITTVIYGFSKYFMKVEYSFYKLISLESSFILPSSLFLIFFGVTIAAIYPHHAVITRQPAIPLGKKLWLKKFIVLGILLFAIFWADYPSAIIFPSFIMFIIVASAFITMNSLNLYYSNFKPAVFYIVSTIAIGLLLGINAANHIKSPQVPVATKINESVYLGIFAGNLNRIILEELFSAGAKAKETHQNSISSFMPLLSQEDQSLLAIRWKELCESQQDHSCRLLSYISKESLEVKLAYLKLSCVNEPLSCLEALENSAYKELDREFFKLTLNQTCQIEDNDPYCQNYLKKQRDIAAEKTDTPKR